MYELRTPKDGLSRLGTDNFDRLPPAGYRFVSENYGPMDTDYQNAAVSFTRHMGMNAADRVRQNMLEEELVRDCHMFAMRYMKKDFRDMLDYGSGYVTAIAQETGKPPLEVLDGHLKNLNAYVGDTRDGRPGSMEYQDAVKSYYRDVLNFGKPAYVLQARMDAMAMEHGDGADMDFADAVSGIRETGQDMDR